MGRGSRETDGTKGQQKGDEGATPLLANLFGCIIEEEEGNVLICDHAIGRQVSVRKRRVGNASVCVCVAV